ncbi:MAG: hypothetical protein ABH986_00810 [archaeon]
MPLPNAFYLSNAEYVEEKKRVCVEFSSLNETRRISFPFIPCILVHQTLLDESLNSFLSDSGKKIRTEKIANGLKIFSSDFSLLNEINFLSGKKCILLSPERQFLLEKNWSFFDEFELGGEITKKELEKLPEIKLDFASGSLKDFVSELLSVSDLPAKSFLNKLVLSNILCVKPELLSVSKPALTDFFIESVLFKNSFAFVKKNPKFDSGFSGKTSFSKLKEVDFSFVWPVLFSFPFHNLGFESINCSCCRPENPAERNVLPSSLIEVRFIQDGIYFESTNNEWGSFVHENSSGKQKRVKKMIEWNLRSIPLGPFFRNDVLRVPLTDAAKLRDEGKVVFLSSHDLHWACTKKESFLSEKLSELNKKIVFFERRINELELNSVKENGIAFSLFLDEDTEFIFLSEYKKALRQLFSSVPFQLASFSSAFFDFSLSNSIKCVFASVLSRFREFSLLNSSASFAQKNTVLIDSDNALDLLLEFSKSEGIPVPELGLAVKP